MAARKRGLSAQQIQDLLADSDNDDSDSFVDSDEDDTNDSSSGVDDDDTDDSDGTLYYLITMIWHGLLQQHKVQVCHSPELQQCPLYCSLF